MNKALPLFPVIMGPTASGKSALALRIAEQFSGEIISVDSMQVYRGLNIGTAKPTPEEQKKIPHYLVDAVDFTEKYDVFRFCSEAENLIGEIRSRGKLPVAAGGTGLYMRALLYGLDPLPADETIRKELDALYDNEENFPALCQIVAEEAPADFEKFGNHRRKLIRAREVFLLTGQPMTLLQSRWKNAPSRADARSFVLVWDNTQLRQRIAQRCAEMLRSGWIEETEQCQKNGLFSAPTAWQVLGYREIAAYLNGEFKLDELKEKIITATWQYARRQNTWFRTQHPEAIRINMPDPDAITKIAHELHLI